ncbi:la-related protein 1A isoform X2 [Iris pallida]|uniref:La-related protein 1A isoform X2 n=1 Tax=Iris pallida TaxID=29817 RepID=A0AAX6HGU9_IRIPA|nr:la-related protein 1A isoform X2 [Iris pallida]
MANPSDSNAAPRNPWTRNPPPTAAATASSSAAAPVAAVLAEEPWPPLTAPQIAAEEAQPPPPPPAVVAPVPPPPPPPNRHPNSSSNRRGGRHNHYNQNHHRRNQGLFHPNHHQNRFPATPFHPPPQHVRSPNPNLPFSPALPPMQPQQVWFQPPAPPADWTMIVPRTPLYANGHGYMDGGFAPPHVYHPMIGPHPQFPPMGPPAAQVPPVQGGPAGLPNQDAQLMEDIRRQIEYYFSEENLVKDAYLKQKMDECGWVDLGLIASFRKVAALTKDLEMIRSAMTVSHSVQLEGDKMRVRHDWQKWTLT